MTEDKFYLKLKNTLNQKSEIIKKKPGETVNFFSCGPTVYGEIHIGNSRPIIVADLIVRLLLFQKFKVNFMQNITDIDDKIIKKALDQNVSEKTISEKYCDKFLQNLQLIGMIMPKFYKISDYINLQVDFISKLIEKKAAYVAANQEVYFDTYKYRFSDKNKALFYHQLSKQKLSKLVDNSEQNFKDYKKNQEDFVLWKKTKEGVQFDSPWGKGRPGWHTECSALNDLHFNHQTIDLHLGGIDLKFPHHENERIQYIAVNNKDLSKIWIYNGHINLNNIKISKSIGNVINVSEFLENYNGDILRLIIYNSKYTQPLNIMDDVIEDALQQYKNLSMIYKNYIKGCFSHVWWEPMIKTIKDNYQTTEFVKEAVLQLCHNLNSPNCLTALYRLVKTFKKTLPENNIEKYRQLLGEFYVITHDLLGLKLNAN